MKYLECQRCSNRIDTTWKYCGYCGAELFKRCTYCGETASFAGQRFCTNCGKTMPPEVGEKPVAGTDLKAQLKKMTIR